MHAHIMELKALERFCGASDTYELLWQMLYDQFFSSLSEPGSVQLLSSEAEPHYFSTTRESFPPFPGELWQLLYPSVLFLPTVVSTEQKQSLVRISPLVGASAMRHLPYAAVAAFSLASQPMSLNQYTYVE